MSGPACPGCGQPAEPYTYPPSLEDSGRAWWCPSCLNAKVRQARADVSQTARGPNHKSPGGRDDPSPTATRLRGTGGNREGPPELVELRRAVEASFAMRKEAVIIEKDGTRHIGAAKDPGWRPDPYLITELEKVEADFTARLWQLHHSPQSNEGE